MRNVAIAAAMALISTAAIAQSPDPGPDDRSAETTDQDVGPPAERVVLEVIPREVARVEQKQEKALLKAAEGLQFAPNAVIASFKRWKPGGVVRVAFDGGDTSLHEKIERVAKQWTLPGRANLTLNFRDADGNFLRWTSSDTNYAAEIRITFSGSAYQSLVGLDSVQPRFEGGLPSEASMTLGGFDQRLPDDWAGVTLHEFGHALGLEHEHQSPDAQCDFRFQDDQGYRPRKDQYGYYTVDRNNRRPGLYTYFGGPPNNWGKPDVDRNLKPIDDSSAYTFTEYDNLSIMKYYFPAFLFSAGQSSVCYSNHDNVDLSSRDVLGIQDAYPSAQLAVQASNLQRTQLFEALRSSKSANVLVREGIDRRAITLGLQ